MVATRPVKVGSPYYLTTPSQQLRMLRAGGYRRGAGRAARSLDVSDGVDAIFLPTNFFYDGCSATVHPT
jgi:hypothetical protein